MSSPAIRPTRVRHIILWLTVLLYMVTYFDRVLISTAMPTIQKEFGFSIETVGLILAAFQLSYSLFQIPGGWMSSRQHCCFSACYCCWFDISGRETGWICGCWFPSRS